MVAFDKNSFFNWFSFHKQETKELLWLGGHHFLLIKTTLKCVLDKNVGLNEIVTITYLKAFNLSISLQNYLIAHG